MVEFKYNYILFFEFDGTNFLGWQKQLEGRTVFTEIEKAAKKILGDIKLIGSSRTDSGVHALAYAANILANKNYDLSMLKASLNATLPEDIAINKIGKAGLDFNARFDAKHKVYEYRIWNSPDKNIWTKNHSWHIKKKLDKKKIKEAFKYFSGKHDFNAFCGSKSSSTNKWVNLENISIKSKNKHIVLNFKADRFLNHMVRNIVGTLVDVGMGKIEPENIQVMLKRGRRTTIGPSAPGKGLYLKEVIF
ncbi:MAG: tRNA pseudouridine(38-40) synthase TruA [Elusimicrobia bacterium]|nr:tRNA pseudouridine(38-40) synthase TruA [Candidatus Liberimonas magnetica]